MTTMIRKLLVKLAWWLTTHEGFHSPCDDDHCIDVRNKARHWRMEPSDV